MAGVAGPGRPGCLFKRCRISWRGGTTGRAAGWPASVARAAGGRGAIGAPGVRPGPAGRAGAGLGRIGAPGTAVPVVAPLCGTEPGATICVGACMGRAGGTPGEGGTTGRAGDSGVEAVRLRSRIEGRAGSAGRGCRGPLGGASGNDGPVRGCGGGAGLAGIAIERFTGPGVVLCPAGCARGGCMAVPPPSGGRSGLKAGIARSGSVAGASGSECAATADRVPADSGV